MFARKNHNRLNGSLTVVVGTATVKKTNQCKSVGVRQSNTVNDKKVAFIRDNERFCSKIYIDSKSGIISCCLMYIKMKKVCFLKHWDI